MSNRKANEVPHAAEIRVRFGGDGEGRRPAAGMVAGDFVAWDSDAAVGEALLYASIVDVVLLGKVGLKQAGVLEVFSAAGGAMDPGAVS